MFNYHPENKEEVALESIVQGHFLSPEINIDFQHEKVFKSVFSSLENDVVVQFLNNIDIDEDSETASIETSMHINKNIHTFFNIFKCDIHIMCILLFIKQF